MKLEIHIHHHGSPEFEREVLKQLKKLNMKQSEVAAELVAIKEQAVKSKAEIIARLDTLEETIENASPEVVAALADVRTAVGEIDNLIPDTPTEETPPTEEQA